MAAAPYGQRPDASWEQREHDRRRIEEQNAAWASQSGGGEYGSRYVPWDDDALYLQAKAWYGKTHHGDGALLQPRYRDILVKSYLNTTEGRAAYMERRGLMSLELRERDINTLRGRIDPAQQSYYQEMQNQIGSEYQRAGEQQLARASARGGGSIQSAALRHLGDEQRKAFAASGARAAVEAQRYGDALRAQVAGLASGQADAYLAYAGGGVLQQQNLAEGKRRFDASQEFNRDQMYAQGAGGLVSGIIQGGVGLYSGAEYRRALEEGLRGRGGVR